MTFTELHTLTAQAYARALRTGGDVALWEALCEEQAETLETEANQESE
jgi:hypothetical protein